MYPRIPKTIAQIRFKSASTSNTVICIPSLPGGTTFFRCLLAKFIIPYRPCHVTSFLRFTQIILLRPGAESIILCWALSINESFEKNSNICYCIKIKPIHLLLKGHNPCEYSLYLHFNHLTMRKYQVTNTKEDRLCKIIIII